MGLDAVVFCDCLERGKLKNPHPFPDLVYVAPNGAPEIRSKTDREIELHDDWMESACRHESMMIDGCRLGTAGGIEFLRDALRRTVRRYARDFPVLWKKVIYSGTHTGDHLSLTDVRRLEQELKLFSKINFGVLNLTAEDLRYIRDFRSNLSRLIKVALKIQKPIAF